MSKEGFLFAVLILTSVSQSQTCPGSLPSGMECVGAGSSKTITAHSVTRIVTNSHAQNKALMIPLMTPTEWSTFSSQPPPGVSVGAACPSSASLAGQTSGTFTCVCGTVSTPTSSGWGTDIYTHDSSICAAAVHACKIGASGGTVTYTVIPGQSSYSGSTRNGVTTASWGSWPYSYYFN
jgi:hypothetical protein